MPGVIPAELWVESGRWEKFGPELLRLKDRHERDFCLGPTHEEVITDIARSELRSYRQLPVNFYQVQMKFRDERRPRFGVMRAREFLMKDAYSFHLDEKSLQDGYDAMHRAYTRHLYPARTEVPLGEGGPRAPSAAAPRRNSTCSPNPAKTPSFSPTATTTPPIIEMAVAMPPATPRAAASAVARAKSSTPGAKTIADVTTLLKLPASRLVKTLLVDGSDGGVVALLVRGDHELNAVKAQKLPGVANPLRMASNEAIAAGTGTEAGFLGPVGFAGKVYADHAVVALADFVCGANSKDAHFTGVNWGRDLPEPVAADIRNVVAGDPSPSGKGKLAIARGIEVGHIFQLGKKYSEAMGATVLDESGQAATLYMGCYGIGVTRVVAAAIEQNHDARGIIWPDAIAPFQVVVVPLNASEVATCQGNRRTPLCRTLRRGSRRAARRSR